MEPSNTDFFLLEKQLGNRAASALRKAFKSEIGKSVNFSNDSEAKKATVTSKFISQRLDRLTFVAPYYSFIQNYGFEGKKKNGINMRLKATETLVKAIENSGAIENLADDLSNLRMEEVILNINFNKKSKDGR